MKVTRKEPKFTTSGTNNSTAGVTIDAKLTAGYNDRIVNTAIQLKANYGSKYSDEYYLDAASSWYKEELGAAFKAAYSKNTSKCPIKDSKWAGYSYEEIIQMENSNREDFAKAAFQFYITQKKKLSLKETMIKGYKEMGRINLSLAELGMTDEISLDNNSEGDMAKVE